MTRRERLLATLWGEPVDRPAVNTAVDGSMASLENPDPFNVFNDPSWRPLIELADRETDLVGAVSPYRQFETEYRSAEEYMENGSRFFIERIHANGQSFNLCMRQDPEVATTWTLKHFLQDADDLRAYLTLPDDAFFPVEAADVSGMFAVEERMGNTGVVMVCAVDPISMVACLFSMEDFLVVALTEEDLIHAACERFLSRLLPIAEKISAAFPGRQWNLSGAEYITEPYLPPRLFNEYVARYSRPITEAIRKHGGFTRIHCHGRVKNILPYIVEMGGMGIHPIEPPGRGGDVELADVRREYGKDLVLFGNLEITDIENMPPPEFEKVVAKSLVDGTAGEGKGFMLLPSAGPYGRTISPTTLTNYQTMVRLAQNFTG